MGNGNYTGNNTRSLYDNDMSKFIDTRLSPKPRRLTDYEAVHACHCQCKDVLLRILLYE